RCASLGMSAIKTPLVRHPPLVLLVALRDDLARACTHAIAPLPIMRAASASTAVERLPIVRPLMVIASSDLSETDRAMLAERAADVLAEMVTVSLQEDHIELGARLKTAARTAETRRG
ncbi:MAG: hypothetical protein ABI461_22020, partial [Polyangiaceae bacterium]